MSYLITSFRCPACFLALLLLGLSHCTINEVGPKGESGVNDQQVRLDFGSLQSTQDTLILGPEDYLVSFNLSNFAEVDSAVFTGLLRSTSDTNTCTLELYNASDSSTVSSISLQSSDTTLTWLETGNILSSLPSGTVNLSVRLRSENAGIRVEGGQVFLFLYRPNP